MTSEAFYAQSKSVEQYTPRFIWEIAERVFGRIDVDPASEEVPENTVQLRLGTVTKSEFVYNIPAKIHYSRRQNGLKKKWVGKVWLNPPFGRDVIEWFEKLARELKSGRTTEAIVLWKAALETQAGRYLIRIPEYRVSVVPDARVNYLSGEKKGGGDGSSFTTMIYYLGPNEDAFINEFKSIGDIWKPEKTWLSEQCRIAEA